MKVWLFQRNGRGQQGMYGPFLTYYSCYQPCAFSQRSPRFLPQPFYFATASLAVPRSLASSPSQQADDARLEILVLGRREVSSSSVLHAVASGGLRRVKSGFCNGEPERSDESQPVARCRNTSYPWPGSQTKINRLATLGWSGLHKPQRRAAECPIFGPVESLDVVPARRLTGSRLQIRLQNTMLVQLMRD